MVTNTEIYNPPAATADRIHQMFGQSPDAPSPTQAAFRHPSDMREDRPSREAVLKACSMEALHDIYRRSVDNNGQSQPGRFLSVLPRYTIMGGGTHSLKRAHDGATFNELVGVIIRLAPYRVLYGRPVAGDRMAPSCASLDSKQGYGEPGGGCLSCPQTIFENRDTPWCRSKSRLYIALRQTSELAVIDLTAMSREGLDDLLQWSGQHQADVRDYCVRLKLRDHPRSPATGNNRTSLPVFGGAVVNDGSPEYRQALEQAAELLTYAEGAWLDDIRRSSDGGGGREPARIGGGPATLTLAEGGDSNDRPQLAGQTAAATPADDYGFGAPATAPPGDYDLGPPPEDWSDVDDLPF